MTMPPAGPRSNGDAAAGMANPAIIHQHQEIHMRYAIHNSSTSHGFGIFEGATGNAAIQAMYADAGAPDATNEAGEIAAVEVPDVKAAALSRMDAGLRSDLEPGDEAQLFVAELDDASGYQVAYVEDAGRAGVMIVGPAGDGLTQWTDCSSAQDALDRFLSGNMAA